MVFIIKAEVVSNLLYGHFGKAFKIRDRLLRLKGEDVLMYRHTEERLELAFRCFDRNAECAGKLLVAIKALGAFSNDAFYFFAKLLALRAPRRARQLAQKKIEKNARAPLVLGKMGGDDLVKRFFDAAVAFC